MMIDGFDPTSLSGRALAAYLAKMILEKGAELEASGISERNADEIRGELRLARSLLAECNPNSAAPLAGPAASSSDYRLGAGNPGE